GSRGGGRQLPSVSAPGTSVPLGAGPAAGSSGIADPICAAVTVLESVGFRPTAVPCWLNALAGSGTVGDPSVKFAGVAVCGLGSGGTRAASILVPPTTFSVLANSTGLLLLLYQALVLTLSILPANVGKKENRNSP